MLARALEANGIATTSISLVREHTEKIKPPRVLGLGLLEHYRSTLAEIRETGYVRYWIREVKPYDSADDKQPAAKAE